jgi:hypothetical protein
MKSSWDITPRSKQVPGRALLATCFMLVSCSAYSFTLKMEATYSSETSVDFQRDTRRYLPEDRTLRNTETLRRKTVLGGIVLIDRRTMPSIVVTDMLSY